MPILVCHRTTFYSQLDEEMFFDALKKISAVKRFEGIGDNLQLTVQSQPSDKALRELIGLLYRYDIDMRQLAQFATTKNRKWFCSSESFWSKRVFSAS